MQEVAQPADHLGGARGPLVRILGEQLDGEIVEGSRHTRAASRRWNDWLRQVTLPYEGRVPLAERRIAREHLIEDTAERVQIRPMVSRAFLPALGRQVRIAASQDFSGRRGVGKPPDRRNR